MPEKCERCIHRNVCEDLTCYECDGCHCDECGLYDLCDSENIENCNSFVDEGDVIEVVRCKDCKNLSVHTNGGFYCRETGIEYKSYECEEHYCSYAVKTDKKRGKDWKRKVSTR